MGRIRNKLIVGLAVLLVMLGALATSGLIGVNSYRGLVKNLRGRADELPDASKLTRQVGDLRVTLAKICSQSTNLREANGPNIDAAFQHDLNEIRDTLQHYSDLVAKREQEDDDFLGTEFVRKNAAEIKAEL